MALLIDKTESDNGFTLLVKGEVDLYSSPELRTSITKSIPRQGGILAVDLSEVAYMDSSGVATLVEALRTCRDKETSFLIKHPSHQVRKVLELSRLDTVFDIEYKPAP